MQTIAEMTGNRLLTDHVGNTVNDRLQIEVLDEPGAGGANHHYRIDLGGRGKLTEMLNIVFQNGPIGEHGINGITQEVLMAICIDRLRSFQAGPFSCRENAIALTKLEEAMHWLHSRTRARVARGVEGKTVV